MNHTTKKRSLLLDEKPLCILPSLAVAVGLNEAIILQQINYWIVENELKNRNFVDGYYWTYNSIPAWKEQFPFFSEGTIKRAFSKLEQLGILVKAHHGNRLDRRKWSRIDHDVLDSYLERSEQNTRCIGSKCADGLDQPDPMIGSKCADDLYTENTSEITPEITFIPEPEKSENSFKNFEKPAPAIPSIPDPPKPGLSPPRGKGSAPVLYQAPNNSAYQPVDVNKWIQAWNQADRPGKWPAMSIGMMSSQRSLECLRQFIDHENGDEDAAIATMVKRLSNAKKDPYWKDRAVSAFFLTDPNKLFLTQFDAAPVAEDDEEDFVARMYRLYGDDQNAKP